LEVAPVGRVVNVTFRDDQELPVGGSYGSTWRLDAGRAGAGTLLEHSIHDLDIIEHLCGPIGAVSAHTAALGGHAGIEDTASLSFRLAGGGTGALTSIWHAIPGRFSNRRVEIFCERARLWAEGNMAETVGWEFRAGEPIVVSGDERTVALREHGGSPPPNPDRAFVLAAARARPSSPDFATALRAHAVADAAYRSAAAGGGGIAIPPPR
ncbi:MAG: Gfo/Idh/MocA family oxidoreductase, partial [Acidimicrobiia bacterium]|nr:Gfo/Idh/MocA family oxidoreductase [Acidimicrobiia bacterium]